MERELESTCLAYTRELMFVIVSDAETKMSIALAVWKEDYLER